MRSMKPDPALSVRRVRIPTESGSIPANVGQPMLSAPPILPRRTIVTPRCAI